ncbi:MAG: cobalamin biosynthesis protein CbiN [Methanobacteriota archaeon]|nr:MAG: cobalamin biosynthesis protein CbiN [Euryarchaeota archaeon]
MDRRTFLVVGIVAALAIGVLAVFFASSDPDGLESTALVAQGDKTLTGDAPADAEVNEDYPDRFSYESPLADYSFGDALGKPGEIIAIALGTIAAFLVILGVSRIIARPAKKA